MATGCHRLAALVLVAAAAAAGPRPPADREPTTVVHVFDGDTVAVRLDGLRVRVRLIGVDTPESAESEKLDRDAARSHQSKRTIVALGRRATEYTRRRLDGARVGLAFDVERRDRFGRVLAYVWLEDGTLFNAELLREGYAEVLTIPPNVRHAQWFRQLAREARAAGRGLWGAGWSGTRAPQRAAGGW